MNVITLTIAPGTGLGNAGKAVTKTVALDFSGVTPKEVRNYMLEHITDAAEELLEMAYPNPKREQLVEEPEGIFYDEEVTRITEADLTALEYARLQEISEQVPVLGLARDFEDIAVAYLDTEASENLNVWHAMYILDDGRVGQANINQPHYYSTFANLVKEVNTRP